MLPDDPDGRFAVQGKLCDINGKLLSINAGAVAQVFDIHHMSSVKITLQSPDAQARSAVRPP